LLRDKLVPAPDQLPFDIAYQGVYIPFKSSIKLLESLLIQHKELG
jgi:hypothetical protein